MIARAFFVNGIGFLAFELAKKTVYWFMTHLCSELLKNQIVPYSFIHA